MLKKQKKDDLNQDNLKRICFYNILHIITFCDQFNVKIVEDKLFTNYVKGKNYNPLLYSTSIKSKSLLPYIYHVFGYFKLDRFRKIFQIVQTFRISFLTENNYYWSYLLPKSILSLRLSLRLFVRNFTICNSPFFDNLKTCEYLYIKSKRHIFINRLLCQMSNLKVIHFPRIGCHVNDLKFLTNNIRKIKNFEPMNQEIMNFVIEKDKLNYLSILFCNKTYNFCKINSSLRTLKLSNARMSYFEPPTLHENWAKQICDCFKNLRILKVTQLVISKGSILLLLKKLQIRILEIINGDCKQFLKEDAVICNSMEKFIYIGIDKGTSEFIRNSFKFLKSIGYINKNIIDFEKIYENLTSIQTLKNVHVIK